MQTQYIRDMLINIFEYLPQREILKYLPHPKIFTDAITQLRRIEPSTENTGLDDIYLKSELVNIATTSVLHSGLLDTHQPLPPLLKILLSLIYNETIYEEIWGMFFPDDEILSFEKLIKLPKEELRQYCDDNRIEEVRICNDLQALQKETAKFIQRYTQLKKDGKLPKPDTLKHTLKKASSNVKLDIDVDQDQDAEIPITSKTKNQKIGTTGLAVCIGYYILGVKNRKQKAIVGHVSSRIEEIFQEAKESLTQDNYRIERTYLTGGSISNMTEYLPLLCEPQKYPELQNADLNLGQPHGGSAGFHVKIKQPAEIYHSHTMPGVSQTEMEEEKDERARSYVWATDKGLIDTTPGQTPYFKNDWSFVHSKKLTLSSAAASTQESTSQEPDTAMTDVFPSPISQPPTSQPSTTAPVVTRLPVAQIPPSPAMTQTTAIVTLMDTEETSVSAPVFR